MEQQPHHPTAFDLLFGIGPALQSLFRLGFRPQEEDLHELTCEQYESYFRQNGHTNEKVYALLPKDPKKLSAISDEPDSLVVITESDLCYMKSAWRTVERYCAKAEGVTFHTDEEKLLYTASQLPDVFIEGTRYEGFARCNMRVAYKKDNL